MITRLLFRLCCWIDSALVGLFFVRHAANEAAAEQDAISAANEARQDGDWVQLAVYGDWPNTAGLQRFQKEDAINVVNEFKRFLNTPQRVMGAPWYIGHPDHDGFKDKYKDTRAYGRIKDLQARDDGLFAQVKWSDAGKKLVEDEAYNGHSVNWAIRRQGNAWRPFRLKSVGFTNEPNIPVTPVTAANENQTIMEKTKLIAVLGLAATATDADIEKALGDLKTTNAANETKAGELTSQVTSLTLAKTTAETTAANEKTAREKAVKKASGVLLDNAITTGRLTKADRAQWEEKFAANEFDGVATELAALKPKLNTTSKTNGLGARNAEQRGSTEKSTQIREAVNERMEKHKETYAVAWQVVKKQKPELFEKADAAAEDDE